MTTYGWKDGRRRPGDVQAIGKELDSLRERKGGEVVPDDVVEEARPPDSAMHKCFEWDDEKAAAHHRRWQARTLLRAIVIIPEPQKQAEPMFIHTSDEQGSRYVSKEVLVQRPSLLESAKRHAVASLRAARGRVEEIDRLAEAADVSHVIELIGLAETELEKI